MTPSYDTLALGLEDHGILLVRLNRPHRLNAFTVQMADELKALFRFANQDDAIRAIVVTGAGRAFCARKIGRGSFTTERARGT